MSALLALALAALGAAQAPDPAALAFVEVDAAPREAWVHGALVLRLRVGLAAEFLDEHAVQPFRQRLDVPVHVSAPWAVALPGLRVEPPGPAEAPGELATLALDGGVAQARRLADERRDGREFRVWACEVRAVPTVAGTLRLPAPALDLAYTTGFTSSLFETRQPVDRQDVVVRGAARTLEVRALPEAGRPAEFGGAVGAVRLRAEVSPREVRAGETLKLTLHVEGLGDPEALELPRWRELDAFRVQGALELRDAHECVVTLDLVARGPARQVPSLALAYFDPGPPAGYRVARSDPLEVRVDAAPSVDAAPVAPPAAEAPGNGGRTPEATLALALLTVLVGVPVVVLASLFVRRRARRAAAVERDAGIR
ncbi:MAG: BatD family protein [Planctomycetes bacterium]|nr:BatD family protein [Planctomycetota bacterium]